MPAVLSLSAGLLSVLAFVGWFFAIVPLAGVVLGLIALRRIKAEPHYYTGRSLAVFGIIASLLGGFGGTGSLAYEYATEVPEGYTRISYDDLRDRDRASSDFQLPPPSAKQFDGEKVFIKGYIYPPPGVQPGQKLKQFVLCRDNGDCCFGGDPPMLERIFVTLGEDASLSYSDGIQKLAGTLEVLDDAPASDTTVGFIFYTLDVDQVR